MINRLIFPLQEENSGEGKHVADDRLLCNVEEMNGKRRQAQQGGESRVTCLPDPCTSRDLPLGYTHTFVCFSKLV